MPIEPTRVPSIRAAFAVFTFAGLLFMGPSPTSAELDDSTFNFVRDGLELEIDACVRAIFLEVECDVIADSLVKAPALLGDLVREFQRSVLEALDAQADPEITTPALSGSLAKSRGRALTYARFPERRERKRADTAHFANIARRVRKVTHHVVAWGYDPDAGADEVIELHGGTTKTTYGAAYRRCLTAFLWTLDHWSREDVDRWAPREHYRGYLKLYDGRARVDSTDLRIVDEDCRWYYCFGKCVPYCPTDDPPDELR